MLPVGQTISLVLTDVVFRVHGCVTLKMTAVITQMSEAALQVIHSFQVIATQAIPDLFFPRSVRNPKFKLKPSLPCVPMNQLEAHFNAHEQKQLCLRSLSSSLSNNHKKQQGFSHISYIHELSRDHCSQ